MTAPFVLRAHSGATLPMIAANLPTNLLNSYADLAKFVNSKIIPSASWSGGIISSATSLLSFPGSTDMVGVETSASITPSERYGFDEDTVKLMEKLSSKYQFAENGTGVNDELKLCLQKCVDADWGEAADYPSCIRKIASNEATLISLEPNTTKLRVEAFFGGSDIMIAKRGQEYFEQCWQSEEARGKIDFTTSTFPEANHDSVLIDYKKGALKIVFERIAEQGRNRG